MRAQYLPILILCAINLSCQPSIDIQNERASLLETDAKLGELSLSSNNVDEFVAFYSSDAMVIPPNDQVLKGIPDIREFLAFWVEKSEYSVTWKPESAMVSNDGTAGQTFGSIRFAGPGLGATPFVTFGRYVSVWRKGKTGSWECVVNIWNVGPTDAKPGNATPR